MSYNWGRERREGTDRREPHNGQYTGSERRVGERRRSPQEKSGKIGWVVAAVLLFATVDATVWDGYYRHALITAVDRDATDFLQFS